MRSGLLSDLISIGYEIFLEGDNIRYRYQKLDRPPESARSLIDDLKQYKAEVVSLLKTGDKTISSSQITDFEFAEIKLFPSDCLKRLNEDELERLAIMTVDGG